MRYFSIWNLEKFPTNCDGCLIIQWFNRKIIYRDVEHFENEELHLFILGDVYGYDNISEIFDIYNLNRNILNLDGIFTLIFVSKKTPIVKVIHDISGFYPVYYVLAKGNFYLSTNQYELAEISSSPPDIAEIDLWVSSGRTSMGNTVFKNVKSTFSEGVFTFDFNRKEVKYQTYQSVDDFDDQFQSIDEIVSKLLDIIRGGYSYLSKKYDNIICDLSGGSDSRISAYVAYKTFPNIRLYVSNRNEEDYRISHKFAQMCMPEIDYVPPFQLPENYEDVISYKTKEKLGKLTAGFAYLDFSLRTYLNNVYKTQFGEVLVSGWPGEIFKDFWLTTFGIGPKRYTQRGMKENELEFLLRSRFIHGKPLTNNKNVIEYLKSEITKNVDMKLRKDKIIDQIYLKYYGRVGITNIVLGEIANLKIWYPFATNKAIVLSRKIHPKFRILNNIQSHLLYSLNRRCCNIETAKIIFGKFKPFKLEPKHGFKYFWYLLLEYLYGVDRGIRKLKELKRLKSSRHGSKKEMCKFWNFPIYNEKLCNTLKIWFEYL